MRRELGDEALPGNGPREPRCPGTAQRRYQLLVVATEERVGQGLQAAFREPAITLLVEEER